MASDVAMYILVGGASTQYTGGGAHFTLNVF